MLSEKLNIVYRISHRSLLFTPQATLGTECHILFSKPLESKKVKVTQRLLSGAQRPEGTSSKR